MALHRDRLERVQTGRLALANWDCGYASRGLVFGASWLFFARRTRATL